MDDRHLVVNEEEECTYVCEDEYDITIGGILKIISVSDIFYIEDGNHYIVRNIDTDTMLTILGYEELELNIKDEKTCEFMLEKFDIEFPIEYNRPILNIGESYLWLDLSKGILSPRIVTKVI